MTAVKFVNVGKGHLVNANSVLAVISPSTACGRRYSSAARKAERYIDCTRGSKLRSLLLINDGSVMGSTFNSKTLLKRIMTDYNEADSEEEKEPSTDEDH